MKKCKRSNCPDLQLHNNSNYCFMCSQLWFLVPWFLCRHTCEGEAILCSLFCALDGESKRASTRCCDNLKCEQMGCFGNINLSYICRKWVCIWYHCGMRGCIWSGFVFDISHAVYRLWVCNWWLVSLDRGIENATTYDAREGLVHDLNAKEKCKRSCINGLCLDWKQYYCIKKRIL